MKSCYRIFALIAFLLITALPVLADIATPNRNYNRRSRNNELLGKKPPKPPQKLDSITARMRIAPDSTATEARLIIPRSLVLQMKAELDGDDSQVAAATSGFNLTPTQTVFAGLCLSLSFVLGGVWFVGSRMAGKKAPRVAAVLAVLALGGAAATTVYANVGPPPVARSLTSKILIPEATTYGATGLVKVEFSDEGPADFIELRLPPKAKSERTGDE